MTRYTYADLIDRRTGQVNRAAFAYLLDANIVAETNLAMVVHAGLSSCATRLRYCEVRGWYAEVAATLPADTLTAAERAEIVEEQKRLLLQMVASVQSARQEAARQMAQEVA